MASNFQQLMAASTPMISQQRSQQQQQQQQQQANSQSIHVQQCILAALHAQPPVQSGWQVGLTLNERILMIYNILGTLRHANSQQPNNSAMLSKLIEMALKCERECFVNAPHKDGYKLEIQNKLDHLQERPQPQSNLQQSMHQQAQAQPHAQIMMMNPSGMQGQGQRLMVTPNDQQLYPHLQHQTQSMSIPGQQPQPNSMGMSVPSKNPPQNPQFPSMQHQHLNINGRQGFKNFTTQENALLTDIANRMISQTSEEAKNDMRARLQASMSPLMWQRFQAQGMDPLIMFYRQQAAARMQSDNNRVPPQQIQMVQQSQSMANAPAMQPQRSMQQSPMVGQISSLKAGNPNSNFASFMGSVDVAAHQQQQGVMAQAEGQIVVPASSGAGAQSVAPQPVVMSGRGMKMNDQRGPATPDPRGLQQQKQQQMFNAQQIQTQRLQHAQAQQQTPSQARINAVAKAQQLGLQGQSGEMVSNQVPTQPSPSMSNLNTPMRTSQQMSPPETSAGNPSAQFGQALDPRFMQGNSRQPGAPATMNSAAMFAHLGAKPGLMPDSMNEVMNNWQSGPLTPGVKQPVPLATQVRPSPQIIQPSQFNGQVQGNQFPISNLGPRPANMVTGISPQQQMILQQPTQNIRRHPNPMIQQRGMPSNLVATEQQKLMQMDSIEIPSMFINQQNMPQGYPPEIRKWGQLKQWVSSNPNLGPNTMEVVKSYQKHHLKNIMQKRAPQQPQQNVPQNNGSAEQITTPDPGVAAPVAPMGQPPNPMPANGSTVNTQQPRQPNQVDIQSVRNHPSGKMLNATDDQIRNIFMRGSQQQQYQQQQQQQSQIHRQHQLQLQQQQHDPQRRMMNSHQAGRAPQVDLQHPSQPVGQPQAPTGRVSVPAKSMQALPPKRAANTTATEPSSQSSTHRQGPISVVRPQTSTVPSTLTSSPAQPLKNLKRTSSESFGESTNPISPCPAPSSQSIQTSVPNQKFRPLTPQQVSALSPEHRMRYDVMLLMTQSNRNVTNSDLERVVKIHEQVAQENIHMPVITMDAETKDQVGKLLMSLVRPTQNITRIIASWFKNTGDEERLRTFFRMFQDSRLESGNLRAELSISLRDVELVKNALNRMVNDLRGKIPPLTKQESTAKASRSIQSSAPLSSANLQQQQLQLQNQQQHQKSNSRSSHTSGPPATFLPGATSPHGAPSYADKKKVDMDLQIPPRKKQKLNTVPGHPSSAQTSKAAVSDLKKQKTPEQPVRPALVCPESDCDRNNIGFEKEEDIKRHIQDEHVRPLENPVKFALGNMSGALGIDSQSQSGKTVPLQDVTSGEASIHMTPSFSKQGQSPNNKEPDIPSTAIPMMRQASTSGQAGTGGKSTSASKASLSKEPAKAQPSTTKEPALKGVQPDPMALDPWSHSTVNPNDLFQVYRPFESGANGAISGMSVFRGITPDDTPESSKDGASEPTSDISEGTGLDMNVDFITESWMPFGPRDTDGLNGEIFFHQRHDDDFKLFDEELTSMPFQAFDNANSSFFDKGFAPDTSMFSLDGN